MKYTSKLFYTCLYVLILLVEFIIFAKVKNSGAGTFSLYLSIFFTVLLVSALYLLATQKISLPEKSFKPSDTDTGIVEKVEEQSLETDHEEISIEQDQIDIQKIIPKTTAIDRYAEELLQNMAKSFAMVQGLLYIKNRQEDLYHCYAQYAYFSQEKPIEFTTGETLPGQAVKNKTIVSLNNIPDQYMTIASGLGQSNPKNLVFVPLKSQDEVVGLIEYATFEPLTEKQLKALEGISKKAAETIYKHLKGLYVVKTI